MAYEVVLTKKALSELQGFPAEAQFAIQAELVKLAEDPFSLSRKTVSPPYPPGGMMREFESFAADGVMHHFVVLFHFGVDEKTLIVRGIGYRTYTPRL
jgi:hypothetical protein